MRVVFVCAGNTCRSPMAAALWRAARPADDVASAGIAARDGHPATAPAQAVAAAAGFDLSGHRSRPLDREGAEGSDLVVALTEGLRGEVVARFPAAAAHTLTLADLAGDEGDVSDPFGGDEEAYRVTWRHLERWVRAAAARLGDGGGAGRVVAVAAAPRVADLARMLALDLRQTGRRVDLLADCGGAARAVADGAAAWAAVVGRSGVDAALAAAGRAPVGLAFTAAQAADVRRAGVRVLALCGVCGREGVRRAVGGYL